MLSFNTHLVSEIFYEQLGVDLNVDTFCIDRTEVTRAHYAAFVADGAPTPAAMPEVCGDHRDHLPDSACASSASLCQGNGCGDYPQTCVGYCDAVAFCEWAGKELCGKIGGGYAIEPANENNGSRWVAACGDDLLSAGAPKVRYSYSLNYSSSTCNTESGRPAPVGSFEKCSSVGGALDMLGNVGELNGVLKETNPESKSIRAYAQGGAAFQWSKDIPCDGVFSLNEVNDRQPFIGFRCCKNVN